METRLTSTDPAEPGPVVAVGVVDSEKSDRALRWAADHARRTGGRLRLVHAFVWPLMNVDVDPVPGIANSGLRAGAETLLRHAVEIAGAAAPDMPVETEIVDGRALDVLLEESRTADALAVGSRGLGRMLATVLGSTSLALARRAQCPLVVVRGEEDTDGPVGVAYESTELGERALVRAGRLAALYGTEVRVVIGVSTPEADHDDILTRARRIIATTDPGVQVEMSGVATARDARELVTASEGTRALVVPARSEGPASASSRTAAVVQYAHTPIWIERPPRT